MFDFPVIVAGAGNRTDVFATVFCDPAGGPPPTIEATFFDQNSGINEAKEEQPLICNGTVVLPFAGGEEFVFGHNRIEINGPVIGGILMETVSA